LIANDDEHLKKETKILSLPLLPEITGVLYSIQRKMVATMNA